MASLFFFFFIFQISPMQAFSARKTVELTPFQKNVQTCLQGQVDPKKLTSLAKIYSFVSERYLLLSSEVLGREVLYKVKDERRKLRYENGKLQLFKFSKDEDEVSIPLNNEVRQRSLTTEAYLTQLLLHADIRSDWMKSSEKRAGATHVILTTSDGEIKSLQIDRNELKKTLECARTDGVESCSCVDRN